MREQSGAKRRTTQRPWKRTQGSGTRMERCTSFSQQISVEEAFVTQTHAEGRIALASRAMNAPRHLDKARILGCPRLPSPAILLFNKYPSRAEGSELSSSVRTSSGGLAV